MKRRVVVTGMGAVTPLGNDVETFWTNLKAGKSGITPIDSFDVTDFSAKIAGQVRNFDVGEYMDAKEARRFDRFAQFAVGAAVSAMKDSGLTITPENATNVGVYIGSGIGGIHTLLDNYQILKTREPRRVSPFVVPMMIPNIGSGQVAILLGAKGPNSTPVTACATGTNAIGDAYRVIERGEADVMIAGGAEAAITDLALSGFGNMKALSTRNDEPERASRPFDADRDGFVMAEGAGILVLESLEHAQARNAKIYAEIVGYGMSADAHHITAPAPGGEGAYEAMRRAVADAGITPAQIEYINAHGTSTDIGDRGETLAIKRLFGDDAYRIAVSSNKSMLGHMLGAAGGVEAIASIMTLREGILPPTINYETPDPDCDLDYVPNEAREAEVNYVLSNSFGFGGHNACIVLKKFTD